MRIPGRVREKLRTVDSFRPARVGRTASVLGVLLLCSGCLGGLGSAPDATNRSASTAVTTTPPNATPVLTDTASNAAPPPNATTPPTKRGGSLDAALVGLLDAENRSAYAAERGLRTRDGRVEVVVELEVGTDLPATIDSKVVASHEGLVQAYVAPDDLAELASRANVTAVRAPNRPATDAETGGSE